MLTISASVLSAMGTVLQQVVTAEVKSLLKVKGQVRILAQQFSQLCSILSQMVEEGQGEGLIRPLVSEALDILYECDHIIDTYEVSKCKPWPLRFIALHEVRDGIAEIDPRLAVALSTLKDHISAVSAASAAAIVAAPTMARPHHPLSPPNLAPAAAPSFPNDLPKVCTGREEDLEKIVHALVQMTDSTRDGNCSGHSVVSIFGIDGLGKTVLAKRVLSHPQVQSSFQSFAWASMSQGTTIRDLAADILCSLSPGLTHEVHEGMMNETNILKMLREVQQRRRCLVFLDDLSSAADWDHIRFGFPLAQGPSRLLVTTRKRELSLHIDPSPFDHWLGFLSEEESFNLLKQTIKCPETPVLGADMEDSARKMLELCGGLPLAISILGGILRRRSTLTDWEDVRRNLGLFLKHEDGGMLCKVVLDKCYDELPPVLKRFFLYLCLFPRGAEIPARRLFRMWTAEDFFLPHKKLSVVEVEKSLKTLVDWGMLQVTVSEKDESTKRIKSYRLHNLMRELCIPKACEDDLLHVLDLRSSNNEPAEVTVPAGLSGCSKIRRLSVILGQDSEGDSRLGEILEMLERKNALHLRTLLLWGEKQCEQRNWKQMHEVFQKCRHLRVLMLEGFESVEGSIPGSIGDLVHLRYLSFKNTRVEGLPRSVCNLKWVEILDLRVRCTPKSPAFIPNVLHKMRRLKQLYLPHHFATGSPHEKLRLHSLKNLLTLKNFTSAVCEESDLAELTHLRKLTVICPTGEAERFLRFAGDARIKLKHISCRSMLLTMHGLNGLTDTFLKMQQDSVNET